MKQRLLVSLSLLLLFSTTCSAKHLVLVHGSGHGAWSWYRLVPLLRSSGHNVTAVDLAASGADPTPADQIRSMSEYFRPLMDLMGSLLPLQDRAILVGHSFGGLAVSKAMERFPEKIAAAVFVTALMPGPSLTISDLNKELLKRRESLVDSSYTYSNGPNKPPTAFVFGPLDLATHVYQLSPIEDWTLATMLVRPLHIFMDADMAKELTLSNQNYRSVHWIYIVAEKDRLNPEGSQRFMIGKTHQMKWKSSKGLITWS